MNLDAIAYDGKAARNIIAEELGRARVRIIEHIRANGQNASGKTIASLQVEAREDGGTLWGRSPFGTLETGRRGGKIPRRFSTIIYKWMQDKGVHGKPIPYMFQRPHKYTPQERGDWSMASAVAHTIAKRGTLLYRQGGRADVYSNVIPETTERIQRRLSALVQASISHISLNK